MRVPGFQVWFRELRNLPGSKQPGGENVDCPQTSFYKTRIKESTESAQASAGEMGQWVRERQVGHECRGPDATWAHGKWPVRRQIDKREQMELDLLKVGGYGANSQETG